MPDIFGFPTPQEVQQQRFQQAVQLFSQAAPGVAPAVAAGQGFGRAAGGLLGLEDPQIERARRLQQVAQEVDQAGLAPGGQGYVQEVARRLRARGLNAEAMMVESRGSELEKQALEMDKLRLGNELARQQIAAEEDAIRTRGQLTGADRILSTLGKLPGSTADAENARNLAVAALERAGVPSEQMTLAQVARAGRAIQSALAAQSRQTVTQERFGGQVSTTTPELSQAVADQIVARMTGRQVSAQPAGQPVQPQPSFQGREIEGEVLPTPAMRREAGIPDTTPTVRTKGGERVDALTLDKAVEIGRRANGSIPLNSARSPNQIMREMGVSESFVMDLQKEARQVTTNAGKLIRQQNNIADIIREAGARFPNLVNGYVRLAEEALRGGDSWAADTVRFAGSIARAFGREFAPEDQLVVAKLNRAVTDMVLTAKELNNLGAITGPDQALLNQLISNPVSYLFRQTGIRGYFDVAGDAAQDLLASAQSSVGNSGIRGLSIPAPDRWFALAKRADEVQDIIADMQANRIDSRQGANAMQRRLGTRVTPEGAEMLSNTGKFRPSGGLVDQATEFLNPFSQSERPRLGTTDRILDNARRLMEAQP